MSIQQWFRPPRLLLGLFVGTALALLAGLGWLGWTALEQEERLEASRVAELLPRSADVIESEIRQRVTDLDTRLAALSILAREDLGDVASTHAATLGDDALIVVFDGEAVEAYPERSLLYRPAVPAAEEPDPQVFTAGDRYENQAQDYDRAIRYFQQIAESEETGVRAAALVRLARNQKKAGRAAAALATYRELEQLGPVLVEGRPADLIGRSARATLLEELGRRDGLAEEARSLARDLHAGRWALTRATYRHFSAMTQQWLKESAGARDVEPEATALALAATVDELWERWRQRAQAPDAVAERSVSYTTSDQSVLVLSRATADRFVALVGGPAFLQSHVIAPLEAVLQRLEAGVALESGEGRTIVSHALPDGPAQNVVRTMAQTRLPWALRVASVPGAPDAAQLLVRRRLLTAGIGLLALLVVAGTYFSARAMSREMEAGRLQSDFVAAVSHEFRTPLTLLRQFSDLLAEGRVTSEEERARYYATLQRGTRRLTRLVEDLLDFGRMEAGSHGFRLHAARARDWLERLVGEFRDEIRGHGYSVDVEWDAPDDVQINVDETAMGRALWNLLDNAVKYSPGFKTIWVSARLEGSQLAISVRDRGIGVPEGQRRAIFRKFVRGSMPDGHLVKGTGLGLALVDQIVKAHGGTVRLDHTSPEGSTFSLVLPTPSAADRRARASEDAVAAPRRVI